ncbi:MAG TPA: hypothetical protein VK447_12565 [Myxococcaceae bacterium]|nr:hypothetical protein [Myxococcaceae bacterium]
MSAFPTTLRVEFSASVWRHIGAMDWDSFKQLRGVLIAIASERLAGAPERMHFTATVGPWDLDCRLERQTVTVLDLRHTDRADGQSEMAQRPADARSVDVQNSGSTE